MSDRRPRTRVAERREAPRAAGRGFTLVELMVAISGGLFVSVMVFTLARDGSRFYRREARMANATLATIIGFERLRADVARAGFLTTPNVRTDPQVCGDPTVVGDAWPAELARAASIRIDQSYLVPNYPTLGANGIAPDRIVLAGAYASVEQFPVRLISEGGINDTIVLQVRTGPMGRLGYETATDQAALLGTVFQTGRALRIVDNSGQQHFATILSVAGGDEPTITVSKAPRLRFREDATLCGLRGNETGALVNVVNFIQYDLRNLSRDSNLGGANANYTPLYAASADAPFEEDRTELVRVELGTDGNPIAGTEELIAEYAVDLRFGITVVNNIIGFEPQLLAIAPNTAAVEDWAGDVTGLAVGTGPNRIRSVRVRLATRSREADRDTAIQPQGAVAPNLYRIGLGEDGAAPFARMRTLQADVAIRNHWRALW